MFETPANINDSVHFCSVFWQEFQAIIFYNQQNIIEIVFLKFVPDPNAPNSLIRSASDGQNGTSLSEMDILIRKMADELHIDAERAIEGLKKDKELWDRLQHVKKSDGHADQENHDGLFTTFIFRLG